jgi:hypothetical protein
MSAAEVTAYLTDRNRQAENSWNTLAGSAKDAHVVAATDYIEQRWGMRFGGQKQFRDISRARSTMTFPAQPADTTTVTLAGVVYTFNTVLGGANSVLIGASTTVSIQNLANAILAVAAEAGVTHGTGTVANTRMTAKEGIGDTLILTSKDAGTAGNGVAVSSTTGATFSSATLVGGGDVQVPQPLSFPRLGLVDGDGVAVRGMPDKLKFACAEYAVRAAAATLSPDPTVDATGKAVTMKREKVGPIDITTQYEEGGAASNVLRAYPAADRLLAEYVTSGGRVDRG